MLLSLSKDETAVHYFDPALSVLAMLVSRNVLYVVSALKCIVSLHFFFVAPTLIALMVCGPLQFLVSEEFSIKMREL